MEYKEWTQSYLDEFLSLRCAGDILSIASPIQKAEKEISESMAIMRYLRKVALRAPMQFDLIDLCAGNALTSLIAIHLLPFRGAIAIDKRPRKREWERARRFDYEKRDIFKLSEGFFCRNDVIIAVHSCTILAERVIELYNLSPAKYLVIMPCCIGKLTIDFPEDFRQILGKYKVWCWQLYNKVKAKKKRLVFDQKVLSPANGIIWAIK